jgi:uncharacterized protein (TIGR00369 family)
MSISNDSKWPPPSPDKVPAAAFDDTRVRASFGRQPLMKTLGAELTQVKPGEVHIEVPHLTANTQQHGYMHGGAVTSIVDSACGYAALSLMPPGQEVVTVEFKVNFLSPAKGERFVAVGRVVKPGRTLTVCTGEVLAYPAGGGEPKAVAVMQATMIAVSPA